MNSIYFFSTFLFFWFSATSQSGTNRNLWISENDLFMFRIEDELPIIKKIPLNLSKEIQLSNIPSYYFPIADPRWRTICPLKNGRLVDSCAITRALVAASGRCCFESSTAHVANVCSCSLK